LSRKQGRALYRRFFIYQVPFFAIGFSLIILSYIIGVREDAGLVLFVLGASLLILAPFLSIYIMLTSMRRDVVKS